MFIGVDGIIVN